MAIPPRFLEELRARVTLSDVVRKHVRLTRAGREFKGCCPFHNEKTPSFYVNDDKQFFHCFGCGAHGSVIDYVMRHDNLSFPETVESLASLAGMQVPKSSPQDIEKAKKEKSLYTLMEDAAKWMEEQLRLPANRAAYDYIVERGMEEETLRAFRIGYAPGDMQAIRKHLSAKGYTDAQMIECGLLKKSEKSKEPYAFFRDRVMFPVPDRRGRIVAFGGRILPDHLRPPDRGDFKPPKYINSTETPLFHKGGMLYGEPHARLAAAAGEPLIVVEGYVDVIACFRAGFRGALAPLGTALTEDQIAVLWKIIPQDSKIPILCFDGDEAGRRAASRACERVLPHLKPNHSVKIAFLPSGEDPDSLIRKKGRDAFQAVLADAMDLVDFVYYDLTNGKSFSTPESRAGLSQALEEAAGRIADRTVQHYYREAFRSKVRKAFAPSPNAARPHAKGFMTGIKDRFFRPEAPPPVKPLRPLSAAQIPILGFLACIINNPGLFHEVEEELGRLEIPENGLDRLRQAVLSTLSRDPELDREALRAHLLEQGFDAVLGHVLSEKVQTFASFSKPWGSVEDALTAWRAASEAMQALQLQREAEEQRRKNGV
jgi:DNA primase